jgi:hypothetical protein
VKKIDANVKFLRETRGVKLEIDIQTSRPKGGHNYKRFGHIKIMGGTSIMGMALESVILGKRLMERPNIRRLFQLTRRHQEEVCLSRNQKRTTVGRDRDWRLRLYPLKIGKDGRRTIRIYPILL